MMAADYRHIGGRENRLGRHYSRFSAFWPAPTLAGQSLALRKLCDAGSNRRSRVRVRSFGFCTGERMPAERTTMRHVREVLRLTTAGVGLNEIARRVGVAPSTVRLTLKRLARAGLSWPLPGEMTDTALETALFAAAGTKQGHRRHAEPDWAEIHRELKRKHVT